MRSWIFLLAACTPPSTPLEAHVHAVDGTAIGGAVIAVTCGDGYYGGAAVTDDTGVADAELYGDVDLSTCEVTASHAGFDPARVPASAETDVTLAVAP